MIKVISRLALSGVCLVITTILVLFAKYTKDLFFHFYPDLSRKLLGWLSALNSAIPVALWELILVGILLWGLYTFLRSLQPFRLHIWFSGVLLTLSVGVLIFVALWGLNYFAPSMESRMGLKERQYTTDELKEATAYYRDMANEWAPEVKRDERGAMVNYDFYDLAERSAEGFQVLGEEFSCLNGCNDGVKPLLFSKFFAMTGTTGMFIAFTGESTVSTETYPAAVPFTMCHEIGHRMAFAREDEANFAGFLACIENDAPEFRYSGYYMAFIYCYNALYKVDAGAAESMWYGADEYLAADCNASAKHYEERKSDTLSAVTDVVYDNYLQSFDVESGVQSYGEVADLLLAWYFERIK